VIRTETANLPAPISRHADVVMEWLREFGYTHCFFVAGGNIMHFLNGARTRFECIPFVHEVAAGIAVEYFNAVEGKGRAFALVTAGPGLTNIVTAVAGAFLESRELLVIGGQVKSTDLASGGIRQRGIQEIDGVSIVKSICVHAQRIEEPIAKKALFGAVERGRTGRRGPVFLEFCLDAQGTPVSSPAANDSNGHSAISRENVHADTARRHVDEVAALLSLAERPIILIGGGVERGVAASVIADLRRIGVPVQTTWNGIDRIGSDEDIYFGRPNTWGQRFANILIQQADLVIALGTRLGLQQTGFNWQQFVPLGKVVQVDIDDAELQKGHPHVHLAIAGDANVLLRELTRRDYPDYSNWRSFCAHVKSVLPLSDPSNDVRDGYINPYDFYSVLSRLSSKDDILVPASSGGANSTAQQAIEQRAGQFIVTDKGLAAMGYGLSGAIGAALAWPQKRTVLIEGDGGFIQNAQELGTVAVNAVDLKIFIFANEGYASIRTTQKNYFNGAYVGCDTNTGLGFPDWGKLFDAFGIPVMSLQPGFETSPKFLASFEERGPRGYIVPVDPEQMYFPKITSRVTESGGMESNPLHMMTPDLSPELASDVLRYLTATVAAI
jgi:acetolactate synthase-1/2/3 large subunit